MAYCWYNAYGLYPREIILSKCIDIFKYDSEFGERHICKLTNILHAFIYIYYCIYNIHLCIICAVYTRLDMRKF